jgi:hypothetical protein
MASQINPILTCPTFTCSSCADPNCRCECHLPVEDVADLMDVGFWLEHACKPPHVNRAPERISAAEAGRRQDLVARAFAASTGAAEPVEDYVDLIQAGVWPDRQQ